MTYDTIKMKPEAERLASDTYREAVRVMVEDPRGFVALLRREIRAEVEAEFYATIDHLKHSLQTAYGKVQDMIDRNTEMQQQIAALRGTDLDVSIQEDQITGDQASG